MKPIVMMATAVSSTAAARFRRRVSGIPASSAPQTIIPPVQGNRGLCFAAAVEAAVIVRFTELLPPAVSADELLESDADTSDEFEEAHVSAVVSA